MKKKSTIPTTTTTSTTITTFFIYINIKKANVNTHTYIDILPLMRLYV